MKESFRRVSPLLLSFGTLVAYCMAVALLTGDIGFEGDDWWIFSWGYWYPFPESVLIYAREALRPVEGLYWLTLFHWFGFNKVVFHFCSLMLLAGGASIMGLCLSKAFPDRRTFTTLAVFFAFFMPVVSCLTPVMTTDNSRLSVLLFWCAVLLFQRWAERSASPSGLGLPLIVYLISFLTYEAASLLIFTVPFLVIPVYQRLYGGEVSRTFLVRLGIGICAAFGAALSLRFLLLSGGAVGHRSLLPPAELIWSYVALLPFYLAAPFTSMTWEFRALALGAAVAAAAAAIVLLRAAPRRTEPEGAAYWGESGWLYPALLGFAILFLGMLPYQMAGYGSVTPKLADTALAKWGMLPRGYEAWFNFNWSSRIYCSAAFGMAILLALLGEGGKVGRLGAATRSAAIAAIGFMAVFHAGLITDWQEASRIRNELCRSVVAQVPGVKQGTNFVFVDLDSTYKRAVVFRGWIGLTQFVRMLYKDPDLGAWYIYPYAWQWPNEVRQQAFISAKGFVSRGLKMDEPVPLDSLIVLKREGKRMVLVETLRSDDGTAPTGINWYDIASVDSNRERIVPVTASGSPLMRPRARALTRDLLALLQVPVPEPDVAPEEVGNQGAPFR
jgi:hypothetical protein